MAVLYLIVCAAWPAEDTASHAADLLALRWDTCVIATPEGRRFFDAEHVQSLTGHPVRMTYKDPDADDVLPSPDAMVLAPASFNTINKLAAGISDTLALGLLNEALGAGLPIIAAPWAEVALRNHPAYPRSVDFLRDAGVALVGGPGNAGDGFPWQEVLSGLEGQWWRRPTGSSVSSGGYIAQGRLIVTFAARLCQRSTAACGCPRSRRR